ncbi:response regulator transcription factor [Zhouia sp. PK063]|uniref:response regulator transcription factor n=1 Tax=Zhouia sp. PK063 TaxID=3373602 RepID=UPI0037B012B8
MKIPEDLTTKLLSLKSADDIDQSTVIANCKNIAFTYATTENAIAVLSDLISNHSYIYNGGLAHYLDLYNNESYREVPSIWEEDIFLKMHPDDLQKKYTLEMHFFDLCKSVAKHKQHNYQATIGLRMLTISGSYQVIKHRILYLAHTPSGTPWLTLCLYSFAYSQELSTVSSNGNIINTSTGEVLPLPLSVSPILSKREIQILQLIQQGKLSKEIAEHLAISIHTVNRHRQNVLEKLNVQNSIEACRIAALMHLI